MRKDEFDEQELTTADLAEGKHPTGDNPLKEDRLKDDRLRDKLSTNTPDDNRPGPVLAERPMSDSGNASNTRVTSESAPLFPNNELEELRNRWSGIQTAFVDEPRRAVEQADGLVASAMKRLAEVFAEERSNLERQWDRGDNVSTEDLRVALQRYRSFFQRLLSI
jgi:hypothetical protein